MRFDAERMVYGTQPLPDGQWFKFGTDLVQDDDLAAYAAGVHDLVACEIRGIAPAPSRAGDNVDCYTPDGQPVIGRLEHDARRFSPDRFRD